MSTWCVWRDKAGTLHVGLERLAPRDATIERSGIIDRERAAQVKTDLEALEEYRRAVEAGQLELFDGEADQ